MNGLNKRKYLFSAGIDNFLTDTFNGFKFTTLFFKEAFKKPFYFKEAVNQCFEIGIKSLGLITITGFIIGFVFVKQSRPSLESFGATSWLPSLMGIATIRAFGTAGDRINNCRKGRIRYRGRAWINESYRADRCNGSFQPLTL